MKKIFQSTCLIISFCLATPSLSLAGPEESALLYPELQVSPRATERIELEVRREEASIKRSMLPIQLSAATTLLAGLLAPDPKDKIKAASEDVDYSRQAAIGVGVSWLALSYYLGESYRPYARARSEYQGLPKTTQQQELSRERIAEEHIEAAGSLGKKLMWGSVITNALAAGFVGSHTEGDGKLYTTIAGLAAFAPLLFKDHWQRIDGYHQEYKKKIYAPIAMPMLAPGPQGTIAGLQLNWTF
jgi:hypothetical protein